MHTEVRSDRTAGRMPGALFVVAVLLVGLVSPACRARGNVLVTNEPPAAAAWEAPQELTLITLNVHDLYLASSDRPERMRAIARLLLESDADVVALQEAFIGSDRRVLEKELVGSRFTNRVYFDHGVVGSGLWVLSAWPLVDVSFHRFAARGKWYKPWHGDWWAGKGVGHARLRLPAGDLDVFDTHAHAAYNGLDEEDEYFEVRSRQHGEMLEFVASAGADTLPGFLLGDLNCATGSSQYQRLLDEGALQPLLDVPTPFDHLFALPRTGHAVQVLEAEVLDVTHASESGPALSDHDAYRVRVRVEPVP